jgi:hypothetical protein
MEIEILEGHTDLSKLSDTFGKVMLKESKH